MKLRATDGITMLGPLWAHGAPAAETRPNIVIVGADDMGQAELGVQGCKHVPTPSFDAIVQRGVVKEILA
jgi:hypothetical protein